MSNRITWAKGVAVGILVALLSSILYAAGTRLSKEDQHAQTPYKDEANVFTQPQQLGSGTTPTVNGQIGFDGTNLLFREGGVNRTFPTEGITQTSPIGTMVASQVAPDSTYVECDGSAIPQSGHGTLFSQLGHSPTFQVASHVLPNPGDMFDIQYSPELGIYVGLTQSGTNSGLMWSTDGLNWHVTATPIDATPSALAYCSGLTMFVMTTATGTIMESTDGKKWSRVQIAAEGSIGAVACSSSLIVVAPTSTNTTDNATQSVYTSSDGLTWTRRQYSNSGNTAVALFWSNTLSLFILSTSGTAFFTSPDAITWTQRTGLSATVQFAESGSLVVAVGAGIASSTDGATWTSRSYSGATYTGVAYLSGATNPWVAWGTTALSTSSNGTTWVGAGSAITGRGPISYSSTDSKYFMAGSNSLLITGADLETWTGQTPASTSGFTFLATASPTSTYVAAGSSGTIHSSTDSGATWVSRTSNAGSNNLNALIYVGGSVNLYIAAGAGGTIVTSPDGTTWTARTSNTAQTLNAIAYDSGSGTIVAVGNSGAIVTSTNGTTWTSRTSQTTSGLFGVARNGSVFCAVGGPTPSASLGGIVVTSSDGTTWTKQSVAGVAGVNQLSGLTSDGTNFYALPGITSTLGSSAGVIYKSTDNGVSWSSRTIGIPAIGLTYLNSQLIAYTANSDLAYSTDGASTWAHVSNRRGCFAQAKRCRAFNGQFLLSRLGGTAVSSDGVHFNSVGGNAATFNAMAYNETAQMLVVVGNSGAVALSDTHGTTFTRSYSLSGDGYSNLASIAYSASLDRYVAVSNSNPIIYTATDPVTWTQAAYTPEGPGAAGLGGASLSGQPTLFFNSVIWADGKFVAIGAAGHIATSTNGTSWTRRLSGVEGTLQSVTYNTTLDLFAAVGGNGSITTSPDGETWTARTPPHFQTSLTAVATIEEYGFMAISSTGRFYSPDGINWYSAFPPPGTGTVASDPFYNADEGGSLCLTSGSGTSAILVTRNGKNFNVFSTNTFSLSPTDNLYDPDDDTFIACGGGNTPNGAYVYKLARTYNRATHFALPLIPNTWIKATN